MPGGSHRSGTSTGHGLRRGPRTTIQNTQRIAKAWVCWEIGEMECDPCAWDPSPCPMLEPRSDLHVFVLHTDTLVCCYEVHSGLACLPTWGGGAATESWNPCDEWRVLIAAPSAANRRSDQRVSCGVCTSTPGIGGLPRIRLRHRTRDILAVMPWRPAERRGSFVHHDTA